MASEILKNDPEVDVLKEAIASKFIMLFSSTAILGIGIWMLLSPDGAEHSSVEKGSVYVVKEMWSTEAGVVFCVIGILFITNLLRVIFKLRGQVWKKGSTGHYFFENQARVFGLASLRNGKDMMIFNKPKNEVLRLEKYDKVKQSKYLKPKVENGLNNSEIYWNADETGYALIVEGELIKNMSSKYEGDDLVVSDNDSEKKYLLRNYKNSLDNTIRIADSI